MLMTALLLLLGWTLVPAQQISPKAFSSQQTERQNDRAVGFLPGESDWTEVFPIQNLTPKRKIGWIYSTL